MVNSLVVRSAGELSGESRSLVLFVSLLFWTILKNGLALRFSWYQLFWWVNYCVLAWARFYDAFFHMFYKVVFLFARYNLENV